MAFLDFAKSRKSIRRFEPATLTRETVDTLLEAARYAPSAGNCQPWHFVVVRNKAIAARLQTAAYGQSFVTTAAAVIAVCIDIPRATAKYGARGEALYSIQDTAAAIQNILLCAKDLGLGTCWMGAFDPAAVSEVLSLSGDFRPVALIAVGKPAADPAPRPRREIAEIATFFDETEAEV